MEAITASATILNPITLANFTSSTATLSQSSSSSSISSLLSSLEDSKHFDELLDVRKTFILTNTICLFVVCAYKLIQYLVLGTLRVSEQQHLRETFWDYFLQKTWFILCIMDTETYTERSPWAIWFTILGSIVLLSRLCRDRFEYLCSMPQTKKWPLVKISILMSLLLLITVTFTTIVLIGQFTVETLFLLADASYVLTFVISVITRLIILHYDNIRTNSVWENRGTIIYYSDLIFAMSMLFIDLFHHLHLLFKSHTYQGLSISLVYGYCVVKVHTLILEIRRRYKRHKNYLLVVQLVETNFSMASQEDLEKNSDDCAICWDQMELARKLPCGHLFHNSCLRSWLEQDTSCPTCRTSLKGGQQEEINVDEIEDGSESDEESIEAARIHQRNHFFHFDSSRYTNNPFLSWLPTISIEGFM